MFSIFGLLTIAPPPYPARRRTPIYLAPVPLISFSLSFPPLPHPGIPFLPAPAASSPPRRPRFPPLHPRGRRRTTPGRRRGCGGALRPGGLRPVRRRGEPPAASTGALGPRRARTGGGGARRGGPPPRPGGATSVIRLQPRAPGTPDGERSFLSQRPTPLAAAAAAPSPRKQLRRRPHGGSRKIRGRKSTRTRVAGGAQPPSALLNRRSTRSTTAPSLGASVKSGSPTPTGKFHSPLLPCLQ